MGEIKVKVSDETEKKFRQAAMARFGYCRGSISTAAENAFSEWANEAGTKKPVSFRGLAKTKLNEKDLDKFVEKSKKSLFHHEEL